MTVLGVIGGSGLYEIEGLTQVKEVQQKTPFGDPSDAYITGVLDGVRMVFLPRHGRGHRILPHEVNSRANIWGMKKLGVQWVLSVSAVGSMKEHIAPGHVVVPDQLIDRTWGRPSTFFGDGLVAHVAFAQPYSEVLRGILLASAHAAGAVVHDGGSYVCINGPAFSTKAESLVHRSWGVAVVGMTALPEAKLALEAEISYATLALATDYDCWHDGEAAVTVEGVLATLRKNVDLAKRIVAGVARRIDSAKPCEKQRALDGAIMTSPDVIPAKLKDKRGPLGPILARVLETGVLG